MSAEELLAELRAGVPLVGPSLLASDFAHLARDIRRVEEAGVVAGCAEPRQARAKPIC